MFFKFCCFFSYLFVLLTFFLLNEMKSKYLARKKQFNSIRFEHYYEKSWESTQDICDALRDLVPFVQFKKCEKHPWRSVNFSKVGCFSRFLNYTNGTKSRNASHLLPLAIKFAYFAYWAITFDFLLFHRAFMSGSFGANIGFHVLATIIVRK